MIEMDTFNKDNCDRLQLAVIPIRDFLIYGADPVKAQAIEQAEVAKAFDHYVSKDARFPGEVRLVDGPTWVFGIGYMAAYVGPNLPQISDNEPPPQVYLKVELKRSDFGLTS